MGHRTNGMSEQCRGTPYVLSCNLCTSIKVFVFGLFVSVHVCMYFIKKRIPMNTQKQKSLSTLQIQSRFSQTGEDIIVRLTLFI